MDVREQERRNGRPIFALTMDRTEFRPGDAGAIEAVARSGARLRLDVLRVWVDAGGETWHTVEKPLAAETPVTCFVRSSEATEAQEIASRAGL